EELAEPPVPVASPPEEFVDDCPLTAMKLRLNMPMEHIFK
ncbi:MAG: hypothetical protein ACI8RY_000259, partial [Urechidicola sp.]